MIRKVVFLYCDGPCGDGESSTLDATTVAEAREEAKSRDGWTTVRVKKDGRSVTLDLCFQCSRDRSRTRNQERK